MNKLSGTPSFVTLFWEAFALFLYYLIYIFYFLSVKKGRQETEFLISCIRGQTLMIYIFFSLYYHCYLPFIPLLAPIIFAFILFSIVMSSMLTLETFCGRLTQTNDVLSLSIRFTQRQVSFTRHFQWLRWTLSVQSGLQQVSLQSNLSVLSTLSCQLCSVYTHFINFLALSCQFGLYFRPSKCPCEP